METHLEKPSGLKQTIIVMLLIIVFSLTYLLGISVDLW